MGFGDLLKKIRKEKNISQKELAKELGITQRTISYYENSENPPNNTELIEKIAATLSISVDVLISNSEGTKIHRLVEKLISDTEKKFISWDEFENVGDTIPYSEEVNFYKDYFMIQVFPKYKNYKLDVEESFFFSYLSGGYLLAKLVPDDEERDIEYAIFALTSERDGFGEYHKYIYLASNISIEIIEELYWCVKGQKSTVSRMIDSYLDDDFSNIGWQI